MNIYQILNLIYDNYINENMEFDQKSFQKDYPNEYNKLLDNFENINDAFIYFSLNKKNNNFIGDLNELKNYLALQYIINCRTNGLTYNDIIENTKFNYNQIRFLYNFLKKQFNIKDIVE